MMGIGFSELLIILVIIMIIFGAGKLPEIGSAFGNSIRNFKRSMKEADEDEVPAEPAEVSQPVSESENEPVESVTVGTETTSSAPTKTAQTAAEPKPAAATKEPAKVEQQASAKGKGKQEPKKKSEEEQIIDDIVDELKKDKIYTIRTRHDGLVQERDVFTNSVDRTPFGMKRTDRGVRRDVI